MCRPLPIDASGWTQVGGGDPGIRPAALTSRAPQGDKQPAVLDLFPLLLAATVAAPPASGQAILDAAQAMEARGRPFAADKGFGRLGREAPHSYPGHLAWATFLTAEGRAEQALGPAGVATRLEPYAAAPYAVRASAHLRAGEGERGRAMLDKALEMDPWSVEALMVLASALRESGDAAGEGSVLARALAIAGGDVRVVRAAALADLRAGREDAARVHIGKLASVGSGVTPTLAVAEVYLAGRRAHEALKVLQAALPEHGGDSRVLRLTGRALLAAGAPPLRAAAAFRAAMRLDPDDADAAVGFALSLGATLPSAPAGTADLAVGALSDVLAKEPDHPGALLAQAHLARVLGDPAGARGWLARIPAHHPARFEADNLRALTRLDQEDPYGAVKILREVLGRRPDLRQARLNLSLALLRAGRSTDAMAEAAAATAGLPEAHPLRAYAATLAGSP